MGQTPQPLLWQHFRLPPSLLEGEKGLPPTWCRKCHWWVTMGTGDEQQGDDSFILHAMAELGFWSEVFICLRVGWALVVTV